MEKRYPLTMMCAACIPWTEDFQFDEKMFRHEVANLISHGAKSIYIMGTAGEGYALDRETFQRVVTVFLDECSKGDGVMPMTGIISTSLPEMLERIRLAKELGCRDFQIALPCWGGLDDSEVTLFFHTVCNTVPDCRFVCYNNGNRSKTKVSVSQFVRLAEELPNLVGAKYSTPLISDLYEIATAPTPLTFFLVDCSYAFGAPYGEVGLLNSFASVDFDLAWAFFEAGQKKDYEKLTLLCRYMFEVGSAFSGVAGEKIDSAFDKSIERCADPAFPNRLYPPYRGITEEEFANADRIIKNAIAKYKKLI